MTQEQKYFNVKAIIKPFKLDDVKEALTGLGIVGMTVYDVRGFGQQKGHTELFKGSEYTVDFLPKVMLEVIVANEEIRDRAMNAIEEAAHSGVTGDGLVWYELAYAVRQIRDGQPFQPNYKIPQYFS